jgi:tRNA(Arg) A34 adenosine deaminase TadA
MTGMLSRRAVVASLGAMACGCALHTTAAVAAVPNLRTIPMAAHERAMHLAIVEARRNPVWPFGAVIVRADNGEVFATGVNSATANPILHGEIAAMQDYVRRHGNKGWNALVLYTTAEPCSMCMSALVWAGIGGVVFGTSIAGLKHAAIDQIDIPAKTVIDASPFYHGELLGGVLQAETDQLFLRRKRA